jgi:hypothetical protein
MAVSVESVVGIVLMGLFLNALGNQIKRSRAGDRMQVADRDKMDV